MSMLHQIEETIKFIILNKLNLFWISITLTWLEKKHDFKVHIVDTGVITIDLHNEGLNNKLFNFLSQFTIGLRLN